MTAEDTNRDILNLSQDWANAERVSDTSRLADLLADDFVGIGPRGFMLTKEGWIGRHASGALRYDSLALDEVTVRAYAGAAIVTGRETDTIQYEATIEDPKVFTRPWKISMPFYRQTDLHQLPEYECEAEREESAGDFIREPRTWYPKP